MKQGTWFLKGVIGLMGAAVLAFCLFGLPLAIRAEFSGDFDYGYLFLWMYLPALPFFIGLREAWRLLGYIDTNTAFSDLSVKALKRIKYAAFTISLLYLIILPYAFILGEKDDAPGVPAIGLVIVAASFVVAVFAALLEKLLQNAFEIKSENDLTV